MKAASETTKAISQGFALGFQGGRDEGVLLTRQLHQRDVLPRGDEPYPTFYGVAVLAWSGDGMELLYRS
jgi:hypothetical protein